VWDNGNTGRTLFPGGTSRHMYCLFLEQALARYEAKCHAWCVMTTHYHLLVRTRKANLDRVMQYVNARFASWLNWERGERGHLFCGRYSSRHISTDGDVLGVARYIDLNPVLAGVVRTPGEWKWSSYRGFMDPTEKAIFHEPRFVLGLLDVDAARARRKYAVFVADGLEAARTRPDDLVPATHGV
jgi:REP element-mobilizing transposase RayT